MTAPPLPRFARRRELQTSRGTLSEVCSADFTQDPARSLQRPRARLAVCTCGPRGLHLCPRGAKTDTGGTENGLLSRSPGGLHPGSGIACTQADPRRAQADGRLAPDGGRAAPRAAEGGEPATPCDSRGKNTCFGRSAAVFPRNPGIFARGRSRILLGQSCHRGAPASPCQTPTESRFPPKNGKRTLKNAFRGEIRASLKRLGPVPTRPEGVSIGSLRKHALDGGGHP